MMRWPWERRQEMAQNENNMVTAPAQREIKVAEERLARVNRILKEAKAAEAIIRTQRG